MRVALFRRGHFNAAHRLYNKTWDDKKNFEVYGKCANPNFHGHNYELEIRVSGEVDPELGYLIDLKYLKEIMKSEVEDRFDHKNLNVECEEFKDLVPSIEHISYVIYTLIRAKLDSELDLKVRVYETPRNYAEYPAD